MTTYIPGERVDGVYTAPGTPGTATIRLTFPTRMGIGVDKTPFAAIEIRDPLSGELIAEVEVDGASFTGMLGGSSTTAPVTVTNHPERIGKRMQNISTEIPSTDRNDTAAEAELAKAAYLADGWESVGIRRTNSGHSVVAYRWVQA